MKEIELSQGFVAIVDDEDFEELNKFKWCVGKRRNLRYAKRTGNRRTEGKATIIMHRVILNAPQGQDVDHKDGDGLNNRKENLRFALRSQNGANAGHRGAVSGYKGVHKSSKSKNYTSMIVKDGFFYYLGTHKDPADAALAYDKKALELFEEFAKTNF